MNRPSFRVRLSALHTAAVACCLGLAAFGGHWALSRLVLGQLDAALLALAETEAAALQTDPQVPVRVHEFGAGTAPPQFARLDRFVQIADLDGRVVACSANLGTARLPLPETMLGSLRQDQIVFKTFDSFGDEPIRIAATAVVAHDRKYVVEVAGSLDDAHAVLGAGRWLFAGLSALLLATVAVTSAIFARRALQPIDEVVGRVWTIGETNLGERIPHPGSQDEIGRLVDTLNAMLERVERGLESQRRFTVDASHELRSPLSRLRAELEVTLRRRRETAEYEETLRSCLGEVERLAQLTEGLLILARLDSEKPSREAAPVPLMPIVDDAVRRLVALGERRAVRLLVEPAPPGLAVWASPTAIRLALANVLDNAIKFSTPGGEVRVGISAEGPEVLIAVRDNGPGVEPEELPQLFQRFHRGSAARSGDAPGFGLGLAISKAAIERQGGRIVAENGPRGGATFRIRLPTAG